MAMKLSSCTISRWFKSAAVPAGGAVMSAVALAIAAAANGQTQAPPAHTQPAQVDNYYAAGNRIEISTPMAGDVIVAGRQIDIDKPVGGDILAAGWRVTLADRADDDVRIAAAEVVINAPVAGDLTIAGGDVTIGSQSRVSGRSWLTGRTVRVEGVFARDLRVAGATVQIGGEIQKPLQVVAERLEILPSARILGPLIYKGSNEARIAEGAVVNGPITYDRIPQREARRAHSFPAVSSLLFSIHLFLAGLLVVIVLPRVETSVVATLRGQPGRSLLAGFVLLVTAPAVAILLIVSILGLPIGLAIGAAYAIALFSGVLVTAFFLGDAEARLLESRPIVTRGQHAVLLLAGVLTLALLRSVLGGVVVFASVVFGLGALMLTAYQRYSQTSSPEPA
jgi:cytoskeletal protein CcmA (bactofilin family)